MYLWLRPPVKFKSQLDWHCIIWNKILEITHTILLIIMPAFQFLLPKVASLNLMFHFPSPSILRGTFCKYLKYPRYACSFALQWIFREEMKTTTWARGDKLSCISKYYFRTLAALYTLHYRLLSNLCLGLHSGGDRSSLSRCFLWACQTTPPETKWDQSHP